MKNRIPIDLYRSIQYKIELVYRKQRINANNESQAVNAVGLKQLELPPRGPVIHLDNLRPKSVAYSKLKKITQQKREEAARQQKQNEEEQTTTAHPVLTIRQIVANDFSYDSEASYQLDEEEEEERESVMGGDSFSNEIENLENRIQSWHKELGGKAFVPRLRNAEKLSGERDVKEGESVYIKHERLSRLHNFSYLKKILQIRSRSSSETSSSGGDNNSVFDELNLENLNEATVAYLTAGIQDLKMSESKMSNRR